MPGRARDPLTNVEIELQPAENQPRIETRRKLELRGLAVEHVRLQDARDFSYKWEGNSNYVALHDLKLNDGEITLDHAGPVRQLDLRDRITFVPRTCEVVGWSSLADHANQFTAVYYDPAIIPEELDAAVEQGDGRPMLYFQDPRLRSTLAKIQSALQAPGDADAIYIETLVLLAALEIHKLQANATDGRVLDSGRLSPSQERQVRDYIMQNLERNISLGELAGLVHLSRFHFTRAFKKTVGLPPHQYLIHCRVERAKTMLSQGDVPIQVLAKSLGFSSSSQFSELFRKATGRTPSQFRRAHR